MAVLAIDPGPVNSALVYYIEGGPIESQYGPNAEILEYLSAASRMLPSATVAVEVIASYGMAVGAEVFETALVSGRMIQCSRDPESVVRVKRQEVKLHLCQSPRANDANIRTALVDRFGGKEVAIGRKKSPGLLFGFSGDKWAALAVAVTVSDKLRRV